MKRAALLLALAACGASLPGVTSSTTTASTGGDGGGASPSGGDVTVPDLIGKTPEEAAALVAAAGFTGEVESSRPLECDGAPATPGRINCQSPEPGAVVRPYTGVRINVYQPTRIAGAIVRDQLRSLIGLTPDDARAALLELGHDGLVSVDYARETDPDCAPERVCSFDVPESGMGVHDAITLYINLPED